MEKVAWRPVGCGLGQGQRVSLEVKGRKNRMIATDEVSTLVTKAMLSDDTSTVIIGLVNLS